MAVQRDSRPSFEAGLDRFVADRTGNSIRCHLLFGILFTSPGLVVAMRRRKKCTILAGLLSLAFFTVIHVAPPARGEENVPRAAVEAEPTVEKIQKTVDRALAF